MTRQEFTEKHGMTPEEAICQSAELLSRAVDAIGATLVRNCEAVARAVEQAGPEVVRVLGEMNVKPEQKD